LACSAGLLAVDRSIDDIRQRRDVRLIVDIGWPAAEFVSGVVLLESSI
jgi:hypothetical protein